MDWHEISLALVGGAMIGIASASWLVLTGKTVGISGILYGMVKPEAAQRTWQASLLLGLLCGGIGLGLWWPQRMPDLDTASKPLMAAAGLLVGVGTRLGGGCTSGHGVCGIGRLSLRSIVGTCVFIGVGVATVYIARHLIGGGHA